MGETASFFSRLSQWIAIIAVLSIVVFSGWFTNSTLRAVERTLPNTLLEQLQELTVIVEQAAEAVTLAERARSQASEPTVRALKAQIEETYQAIVRMRESFVFDNKSWNQSLLSSEESGTSREKYFAPGKRFVFSIRPTLRMPGVFIKCCNPLYNSSSYFRQSSDVDK